ncbi:class I SAM-dependent methyltransferase [Streptomyces albus]|uniref:class I SAM-dependent methyltransferase n=1 Tax=Streptomyces albus TaxID=1888 RepID=UPI0015713294|nr:class I SAM-dependent methyltransferase [Streptomyces albus]
MAREVLRYAAASAPVHVLEVGAGTGKATTRFAPHVAGLTCLEPDPAMAAVLRRTCRPYPSVAVEEVRFETWQPAGRRFDVLLCAQAWHCLPSPVRWSLAHRVLEPGGVLALCWNAYGVVDPALHAELVRVDLRYGLRAEVPHTQQAGEIGGDVPPHHAPTHEIAGDPRFTDLRAVHHHRRASYPTRRYLDLLATISVYKAAPEAVRGAMLREIGEVLDRAGGIELAVTTDLFLARTT